MTFAYVGLGGNRARPRRQLRRALRLLARLRQARLAGASSLYWSAPLGCPGRQPPYCNAVAELQTRLPPARLWRQLRRVERAVQTRRRASNAPRLLDVDFLAHGNATLRRRALTLPHPRLWRRAFVLQPLAETLAANKRDGRFARRVARALPLAGGQRLRRW